MPGFREELVDELPQSVDQGGDADPYKPGVESSLLDLGDGSSCNDGAGGLNVLADVRGVSPLTLRL